MFRAKRPLWLGKPPTAVSDFNYTITSLKCLPPRPTSTPPPSARKNPLLSPPDSSSNTREPPSSIAQVLNTVGAYCGGHPPGSQKFTLLPKDYEELKKELKNKGLLCYVEDKIRCVYSVETLLLDISQLEWANNLAITTDTIGFPTPVT